VARLAPAGAADKRLDQIVLLPMSDTDKVRHHREGVRAALLRSDG
jgi:hypothetical protein